MKSNVVVGGLAKLATTSHWSGHSRQLQRCWTGWPTGRLCCARV